MPGWRTRGYIPHIESERTPQYVTIRLFDSLPLDVLNEWSQEVSTLPDSQARKELLRRIGKYLDEGHGCCLLKNPVAGKIVHDCLLFNHGKRFHLHAWVVMPNHVHMLFTPTPGFTLGKIFHTVKGYTVHRINNALLREGQLWQEEYYDTEIGKDDGMERVRQYIVWNPVKAKLCPDPSHWPWSSADPKARERLKKGDAA